MANQLDIGSLQISPPDGHDPSQLQMEYPDAILWVSQKVSPTIPVLRHFWNLFDAINYALAECQKGRPGFSILLTGEELNIDSFRGLAKNIVPSGLSLEIIGLDGSDGPTLVVADYPIVAKGGRLILRSLLILEHRPHPGNFCAIEAYDGATVRLIDVSFSGEDKSCLRVVGSKTSVHCKDCAFTTESPFIVVYRGARAILRGCTVEGGGALVQNQASFEAESCSFLFFSYYPFKVIMGSTASFNGCSIEGPKRLHQYNFQKRADWKHPPSLSPPYDNLLGILAQHKSTIRLNDCDLSDLDVGVKLCHFKTKAILKKCRVERLAYCVKAYVNSDVEIDDSQINSAAIIEAFANVRGKMVLRRNVTDRRLPLLILNQCASPPDHDFETTEMKRIETDLAVTFMDACYSGHEQFVGHFGECCKCMAKEIDGESFAMNELQPDPLGSGEYCLKLKLCQGCKVVSYCSKECQIADWRDHKMFCQHLATKYRVATINRDYPFLPCSS